MAGQPENTSHLSGSRAWISMSRDETVLGDKEGKHTVSAGRSGRRRDMETRRTQAQERGVGCSPEVTKLTSINDIIANV